MTDQFPFGEPVKRLEQQDKTPKKVFVLGVYASAVHAKWINDGSIVCQALAVASEPCISDAITETCEVPTMLGAIIGDIIGSPYESDRNNIKTTDFPLFSSRSRVTDDTVMTLAVAEGLMDGYGDPRKTEAAIVTAMQKYGRLYPNVGYGSKFAQWIFSKHPEPYQSCGNGSAMRVSPIAWLFDDLAQVENYAHISASVTHNHEEGLKGAEATAAAIFLARKGRGKADIKSYIEDTYHYDLNRTLDEIRPMYHHMTSCQESVPEAIIAFLESDGFEDAIRKAVSIGGDSDTIAAIAGSIAEGFYGIPEELKQKALAMLDEPLLAIVKRWQDWIVKKLN